MQVLPAAFMSPFLLPLPLPSGTRTVLGQPALSALPASQPLTMPSGAVQEGATVDGSSKDNVTVLHAGHRRPAGWSLRTVLPAPELPCCNLAQQLSAP